MKNADKFVVGGQVYDVLSPATFGDYMETIGSACINPDGYAENKLFLAYDDNVQKLFRATTAIAYSELLIKDTNCEPTTMAEALANALSAGGVSYDNSDSGLTASNVQDAIDEVNGDVETVNSDLTNEVTNRAKAIEAATNHNIPRLVPKDISSYIADGTFYKRLNGTDGFTLFEDIYVGDYIKMSRAITAPNQDSQYAVTGSQYVTIIGLDTLMNNNDVSYHHAVMAPGQGFGGTQHFGRKRMYASVPFTGGYVGSEMNASTLGAVVSSGSIATGATINQQLFAEFGTHLKTVKALLSTANNSTGIGKLNGTATGCSTNWAWTDVQSVLMSEVEVYGSVVFSSSGYDTGEAKAQFPLFAFSKQAMNNGSGYYWLKDVASGSYFCFCGSNGNAGCNNATGAGDSVRPRFVIAA